MCALLGYKIRVREVLDLGECALWAGCVADGVLTLLNHNKLQQGQTNLGWSFSTGNYSLYRTRVTLVNVAKQGYENSQQ